MCNGFTQQPSACEDAEPRPIPNLPDTTVRPKKQPQSHFMSIVGILVLAIIVFAVLFLCYKRQMKREILQEMNTQIASTMHRYMAMKDDSEGMLGHKTSFSIEH